MATNYPTQPETQEGGASRDGPIELVASQFERFYGTVLSYLLNRLFDRELAEELTAETFYKAAACSHRIHGNAKQIQIWLLRTATNLANTHYRRMRLRRFLFAQFARAKPATTGVAGSDLIECARIERIRRVLKALPPKDQAVVVLRYYMELPFEDIATILECQPDSVRVRLSRTIKKMRQRLGVGDMNKTYTHTNGD